MFARLDDAKTIFEVDAVLRQYQRQSNNPQSFASLIASELEDQGPISPDTLFKIYVIFRIRMTHKEEMERQMKGKRLVREEICKDSLKAREDYDFCNNLFKRLYNHNSAKENIEGAKYEMETTEWLTKKYREYQKRQVILSRISKFIDNRIIAPLITKKDELTEKAKQNNTAEQKLTHIEKALTGTQGEVNNPCFYGLQAKIDSEQLSFKTDPITSRHEIFTECGSIATTLADGLKRYPEEKGFLESVKRWASDLLKIAGFGNGILSTFGILNNTANNAMTLFHNKKRLIQRCLTQYEYERKHRA